MNHHISSEQSIFESLTWDESIHLLTELCAWELDQYNMAQGGSERDNSFTKYEKTCALPMCTLKWNYWMLSQIYVHRIEIHHCKFGRSGIFILVRISQRADKSVQFCESFLTGSLTFMAL